MVNIISLTTVFSRFDLLHIHASYQYLYRKWCANMGVNYNCVYVLSSYDPQLLKIQSYLDLRGFKYHVSQKNALSSKIQDGLEFIITNYEFDYMMHLDSDEFLSLDGLSAIIDQCKNKVPFIRLSNKWVTRWLIGESISINFTYKIQYAKPLVNAGACISMKCIASCNFKLWTSGMSKGLNTNQNFYLKQYGFEPLVIECYDNIYALEIKTGNDIHSLDTMAEQGVLKAPESSDKIMDIHNNFPSLIKMVQERNIMVAEN